MKESIEKLQLTTSDVTNVLEKVFVREVELAARPKRFGRQLCRQNFDMITKKARSAHVRVRGTASAEYGSEGTQVTNLQKAVYTTVEITPVKIQYGLRITQETINGMSLPAIRDQIAEAGEAMANKEDDYIMHCLMGAEREATAPKTPKLTTDTSNTGDGSTKKFALSGNPKVAIIYSVNVQDDGDKTIVTDYTFDFYSGNIEFVAAPANTKTITIKYYKAADLTYMYDQVVLDSSNIGTLSKDTMRKTRNYMRARKEDPNIAVFYTGMEGDLLADSQYFTDYSKYGDREPILNGELGRAFGLKLMATTQLEQFVILNTNRAAMIGWARRMQVKRLDKADYDSYDFYLYEELGVEIVHQNAISMVLNCREGSADITP